MNNWTLQDLVKAVELICMWCNSTVEGLVDYRVKREFVMSSLFFSTYFQILQCKDYEIQERWYICEAMGKANINCQP